MPQTGYPPLCEGKSENVTLSKSDEDMVTSLNVAFLLTSTFGLIFNACCIIVLMVPKQLSSYSFLLISLCVAYFVQLLYHWIFCGLSVFNDLDFEVGWPKFHFASIFAMDVGRRYM